MRTRKNKIDFPNKIQPYTFAGLGLVLYTQHDNKEELKYIRNDCINKCTI